MAPRKSNAPDLHPAPPPVSSSSPSSFISAISTVAVAQICRSIGYTAAEPAALRSLTDIAVLHIQTLARSAATIANYKGRTQSNILDLTRAIEDITISIGFGGASDPTRPLLRSSVLRDMRSFVRRVKEVPFAKPVRRREWACEIGARISPAASFAAVGREPPGAHVPRWLPCFPENWERREERKERIAERRPWEEKGAILEAKKLEIEDGDEEKGVEIGGTRGRRNNGGSNKRILQQNQEEVWVPCVTGDWGKTKVREGVRFKLWGENSTERRVRMEKGTKLMVCDDNEDGD